MSYYVPRGGLAVQGSRLCGRARFTASYAFIPRESFSDIVTNCLPHWWGMRCWVIARPLSGFAETFSHYIIELAAAGGSELPELDSTAEGVIFVVSGRLRLCFADQDYNLVVGSYVYISVGVKWQIYNHTAHVAVFHWIRKIYERVAGIAPPLSFVSDDKKIVPQAMPNCDGIWTTTRFVDQNDARYDMHVNIVNFAPSGMIPFEEMHVMEHGIYVLCGQARYLLNQDWIEVLPGDFMWLRAFCPQACVTTGDKPFRYLLYKDVNRHAQLYRFGR